MPSIYQLKARFQALLRPLVKAVACRGVTANQVTVLALGMSVGYGVLLYCFPACPVLWLGLPLFMLFRMGLNAIDGMLAREHNMCSDKGAFLNELGDVVADTALVMGFAGAFPEATLGLALFSVSALLTEFSGVCGQAIRGVRRYDGPLGKSDRAFVFGLLGILYGLAIPLHAILPGMLLGLTGLCGLTCINRVRGALEAPRA